MNKIIIPFNKATLIDSEFKYVREAIKEGHISGDGKFTKLCQDLLEKELGAKKSLLTTSCTHALEMAALLLNFQAGDEVIVPSFTFVSTVNAFVLHGAKPVFIDIRPDMLNLDESQLEQKITSRTKAIVPVHYAGVGCEMDAIVDIAKKHNIAIVEDNAHGLFGKYKNKYLGTFGCLATQSFHETKNFTCGEGGALIINDSQLIERAEVIREKGTNRNRFFRGEVDKYTWVDVGSSYVLSDILAAILYAQLEAREQIQLKRKKIWQYYYENLSGWAQDHSVRLPVVPTYCEQPYHMFYLLMPSLEKRQSLIKHLNSKGILSIFHYQALHLSAMGSRFGGKETDCPVTVDIADRLLRLPFYNNFSEEEQAYVVNQIKNFIVSNP